MKIKLKTKTTIIKINNYNARTPTQTHRHTLLKTNINFKTQVNQTESKIMKNRKQKTHIHTCE